MSKLCKTCKNWEPLYRGAYQGFFADYSHDQNVLELRCCTSPLFLAGEVPQVSNGACVQDGYVSLLTGPNFGCVNWEKLEEEMEINAKRND